MTGSVDWRRLVKEGPTVVGMLTASLESGGSIDTAVRELAEDGPKISARIFTDAVRSADSRSSASVTEALTEAVSELPEQAAGYKHSVLLCIAASESPGGEEGRRLLTEASDIALDSVRSMGESYSASLTLPCTTVFGLGIVLPMILMSIVPMLGIGGLFASSPVDGAMMALITLVLVPSAILVMTIWIRRSNPFASEMRLSDVPKNVLILLTAVPIAVLPMMIGLEPYKAVVSAMVISCLLCSISMSRDIYAERKRESCAQGLRDSVFEIGNRMAAGCTFEKACLESMSSRPECEEAAESLKRKLDLCRGDAERALELSIGEYSDDVLRAYIDIRRCSEDSTEDAGRLAITLGRQFHNIDAVETGLGTRLKGMTDTMAGTAMLFAPLVLGMSVSMLEPLSELSGYQPVGDSCLMLTVYLIELCALIALLTSCLKADSGVGRMVRMFCLMTPIAVMVFDICCAIGL